MKNCTSSKLLFRVRFPVVLRRWGGPRGRCQHHLSQRSLGVPAKSTSSRRQGGSDLVSITRESRSDRFESLYWGFAAGLRAAQASGALAQQSQRALVDPQQCGTGHSRLSLLCRVLAEGVSAPSARQCGCAVNLEMDPGENPQTCSKRELERSRRLRRRGLSHGADAGAEGRRSRSCGQGARSTETRAAVPAATHRGRAASLKHSNHVK